MTRVGLVESLKYGLTLFGYLLGVTIVGCGLFVLGGALAVPEVQAWLDGDAIQLAPLVGGAVFVVLGTAVWWTGIFAIVYKLVSDSVTTGLVNGSEEVVGETPGRSVVGPGVPAGSSERNQAHETQADEPTPPESRPAEGPPSPEPQETTPPQEGTETPTGAGDESTTGTVESPAEERPASEPDTGPDATRVEDTETQADVLPDDESGPNDLTGTPESDVSTGESESELQTEEPEPAVSAVESEPAASPEGPESEDAEPAVTSEPEPREQSAEEIAFGTGAVDDESTQAEETLEEIPTYEEMTDEELDPDDDELVPGQDQPDSEEEEEDTESVVEESEPEGETSNDSSRDPLAD